MSDQLDLLGPARQRLGKVQRAVLAELERLGTLSKDEAGAIAHHGKHGPDERCKFCSVDGGRVLTSLINRGLAEKGPEGTAQTARHTAASPHGPSQGLPEGF